MYYLIWIGESADNICAPHCEVATSLESVMFECCKRLVDIIDDNSYVVMHVKTVPTLPFTENNKPLFSQTTVSITEFIRIHEED